MTEIQRQQRAAFIREQPLLWFALVYASSFLGCAVASDALYFCGAKGLSDVGRYLLPLAIALPLWIGLRGWSRRADTGRRRQPTA